MGNYDGAWIAPETQQQPEMIALRALGFLADQHVRFVRFVESTGLSYRAFGQYPIGEDLMVAVLDYLVTNEDALMEFAARADIRPEAAYEARRALAH